MNIVRSFTSGILLPDSDTFLVTGGYDGNHLSSCEKLDIAANTWSSAGNFSLGPREGHASVLFNNSVVVLGGSMVDGSGTNTCEQYDHVSDTWSSTFPSF